MARIELGLEQRPTAVEHPWDLIVQRPNTVSQPLPAGIPISQVFAELGEALLILGTPGAGKTTLLLELARDLLNRAEQDPAHPIPVAFNLSSWAVQRRPLADWLIEELRERYDVPRQLGQEWIEAEQILPLLDGLDEIAEKHRTACVEAINTFRQAHGLLPLVVCSRIADYEALTVRLRLSGAILVQPLTHPQIAGYLEQAGEPLAGVHAALHTDPDLWELLETPLMLSIVALAYQGRSAAEVPATGTLEERRADLFAAYIDAMFKRRGKTALYTRQQTVHWLSWLAGTLARHNQSVLYLEWMQSDWLPTRVQQRVLILGTTIIGGLVFGLAGGLHFGLAFGLVLALLFALLSGLFAGLIRREIEIRVFPNQGIKRSARNALILGLLVTLLFGQLVRLTDEPKLHLGELFGLTFGLLFGQLVALRFGGLACLQHLTLRTLLWYKGFAPLNYVRFLDYAGERIFLRKVGGGYIFVHRLLLEYFASLESALPTGRAGCARHRD